MTDKQKHPGGRPTDYSPEMVEKICQAIICYSMGIRKLCEKFDYLPGHTTIRMWLGKYPEFRNLYLQAKRIQADLLFDETIDIADDDEEDNLIKINRAKLKIDTRKHKAARLLPDEYGEGKRETKSDDTAKELLIAAMKEWSLKRMQENA